MTEKNLQLCSCNTVKVRSELTPCKTCLIHQAFICDDEAHTKCISCNNTPMHVDCDGSKCETCERSNLCKDCIYQGCDFCEADGEEYSCVLCFSEKRGSGECSGCQGEICKECWNQYDSDQFEEGCDPPKCVMDNCDNIFHPVVNDGCCMQLCDTDCIDCNFRERLICMNHSQAEIDTKRKELALLKCNECETYWCNEESLVPGNVCIFCVKYAGNDMPSFILCEDCCTTHKCVACGWNIYYCHLHQRCEMSNKHLFLRWYSKKY